MTIFIVIVIALIIIDLYTRINNSHKALQAVAKAASSEIEDIKARLDDVEAELNI